MERFIPKSFTDYYDSEGNKHIMWSVWDNKNNNWSEYVSHGCFYTEEDALECIKGYY